MVVVWEHELVLVYPDDDDDDAVTSEGTRLDVLMFLNKPAN